MAACLAVVLTVVLVLYIRIRKMLRGRHRFDTRYSRVVDPGLEDKIRMSKKQLETAFDAIVDLICVVDDKLCITRANKSYAKKTGRSVRDLPGEKCHAAFFGSASECEKCPALRTLKTGEASQKTGVMQRIGDDEKIFDISTYAVTDTQGSVVNVIEHIRDVTQERRVNEQLLRAEKLAGIGIMTSGIAHEINNPLSGISGTAENMLASPEKYGLNSKGADRMSMILECASRATIIMKDLLRFSRKQESARIPADLSVLLPRAAGGVKLPGSSRITRAYDIPADIPNVLCDPAKIEQVVSHIVTNSVQAIIEKRKNALAEQDEEEEIIIKARRCGEDVRVDIIDNGTGIPAGMESKIFDPFFTTKSPGEGAGLGLSICHRIIEEHQGGITASTSNGHTCVSVTLPAVLDSDFAGTTDSGGGENA
jgi:two-component system NtrC family sensor kinase